MTIESRLLEQGLISRKDLDKAIAISRKLVKSLPMVLVENAFVNEVDLLRVMADHHGLEFVSLENYPIDSSAVKCVSAKLASHYGVMPVKLEAGVLTLAVSNPLDMSAAEDIETNIGCRVERILACKSDIQQALQKHYGVGADTVERILAESSGSDPEVLSNEESHDLEHLAEDASVVRLVNQLLHEAIQDRATDIHFEVYRGEVSVRRRIDGVLYDTNVPKNINRFYSAIVSRIKLMSRLNIVERRLPQDGRARVKIGGKNYDLRISVVPAIHGEDVVIRILPSTMLFDLAHLGFSEDHLDMLKGYIAEQHGIIFVTGPTGSGKSTTLYACLSRLNSRDRKIITIEDPVEYELKGIMQTQVNPAIGLTFSKSLSSMLRHDPDVMMVGEVRDKETADIAIQTAMTGHLVLSTLHTNDAAGGAVRLIDMGVDPYLITSTVLSFIAQRLVRLICEDCKESYQEEGKTLYRGKGCPNCNRSGYRGRIAISEFLPLVGDIQDAIIGKSSARDIRKIADSLGMRALAQDGQEKVDQGLTTLEELLRVTKV